MEERSLFIEGKWKVLFIKKRKWKSDNFEYGKKSLEI